MPYIDSLKTHMTWHDIGMSLHIHTIRGGTLYFRPQGPSSPIKYKVHWREHFYQKDFEGKGNNAKKILRELYDHINKIRIDFPVPERYRTNQDVDIMKKYFHTQKGE